MAAPEPQRPGQKGQKQKKGGKKRHEIMVGSHLEASSNFGLIKRQRSSANTDKELRSARVVWLKSGANRSETQVVDMYNY